VEFDPAARADLRARAAAVDAAESARTKARLSWLPSLDAFASYSIHGQDFLSDSGDDWTVGVALRWDVFTGLRRPAEAERAGAELRAAELEYRQGLREARGEVRRARRAVASAREAVEASRAAREAAREGRDLLRRRFEEGLATAADLLQAEARATAMAVRAVDALAGYHVAVARLRFARARSGAGARR
jgi:cobalt-zinc-cadmium efflux system outer membrane protein